MALMSEFGTKKTSPRIGQCPLPGAKRTLAEVLKPNACRLRARLLVRGLNLVGPSQRDAPANIINYRKARPLGDGFADFIA